MNDRNKDTLRDRLAGRLHEYDCSRMECDEHCRVDYDFTDEILRMVAEQSDDGRCFHGKVFIESNLSMAPCPKCTEQVYRHHWKLLFAGFLVGLGTSYLVFIYNYQPIQQFIGCNGCPDHSVTIYVPRGMPQ